jgi:ribose/xylose/arabinose/galactoside ABC-type transport system permease subunit
MTDTLIIRQADAPTFAYRARRFARQHQNVLIIWGVLLAVFIVSALISEHFTGPRNLINLSRQSAALALVAIGQTFVLLSAGIDLSVGSTVSLIVVVMAAIMQPTPESMILSALVGLGIGVGVGLFNGLAVTRLKVSPFMVTLATLSIVRGLALQLRQQPQATIPSEFSPYFTGELLGLPIPFFIIVITTTTAAIILRHTRFGRHIYAVGSNEVSTRLSGMPTDRIKVLAYMACGFMTGLAGIYWAARSRAGDPLSGENFAFDSITAVVLGGTSLFGGAGSVWGTLAGVLIIAILGNIMNLTGVASNYQYIFKGILLVVAVMLYRKR